MIELSTYGKKKVFLAILKPDDAAQYGLEDKPWSVCTVTEHVKRNTYLVSLSLRALHTARSCTQLIECWFLLCVHCMSHTVNVQ